MTSSDMRSDTPDERVSYDDYQSHKRDNEEFRLFSPLYVKTIVPRRLLGRLRRRRLRHPRLVFAPSRW